MKIKDAIAEFDKTQKEQEEALKNVAENTEPVEQAGEAKSEGEFVEAPKAEDAPDNETDQEEQLEADAEELDAKADVNEGEVEDVKDEEAKDEEEQAEKSVEDEDADNEENKEEDKADESDEEEAEKSVEDAEQVEKAKVTDEKDADKKKKETKEHVDESLQDPEDEDEGKDKGKKPEKVKKSEDDLSELEGLVGVVLKSYQQSVEGQNAMMTTINELKAQVEALNSKLEQATGEVEETSKSILNDETADEEVEDKAVGYASKNMTPEAEAVTEVDHNNDGEVQEEDKKETFNYSEHSQKFMEKFQQDLRTDGLPRRDVDSYRQAFLDASEGNASQNALDSLYEYINS